MRDNEAESKEVNYEEQIVEIEFSHLAGNGGLRVLQVSRMI
ncbi:hypothetical protein TIFTF001_042267 [Ficus carica]|uniref:Uncharacterized protein n=1 Tax=Ficus carica TaxID=3494 RepID=A0AA87ZLR5_FICCA|nr:hypothetical protein TIFTF001_042267 [Ficus carica]